MNRLSIEERTAIIRCLIEGNSIRSTARITGAARNTITSLLVALGKATSEYQDRGLRNLPSARMERVGTLGYGDVWTWAATARKSAWAALRPSMRPRDMAAMSDLEILHSRLAN